MHGARGFGNGIAVVCNSVSRDGRLKEERARISEFLEPDSWLLPAR